MRIRRDSNYLLLWALPCFWLHHSWLWLLFKGGSLNIVFNFEKEKCKLGGRGGGVAGQFCVFGMPGAGELRQRCKFIHEPAISFISGSLSMNQQSHSLFTRPRDLAILCHILLSCHTPVRQSYFLFRLEAFFATLNTLYNIFNFRKIDIVKEVCWSSRVPYCFPYPPPSSFPVSAGLQAAGQVRMGKGQGPTDLALWNEARRRRPCRSLHTTLHKYI